MRQQLIKRLEEVRPGPGEAKALVDRMKHGICSESDRQHLLEILEAEEAALQCAREWTWLMRRPPSLEDLSREKSGQHLRDTRPEIWSYSTLDMRNGDASVSLRELGRKTTGCIKGESFFIVYRLTSAHRRQPRTSSLRNATLLYAKCDGVSSDNSHRTVRGWRACLTA